MASSSTINLGNIKSNTKLNIKKFNSISKAIDLHMNSLESEYDEIDYSAGAVAANIEDLNVDYSSSDVDVVDGIGTLLATGTIVVTSVVSGVLKIVEYIGDGLTWLGGAIVSGVARLTGNDEFAAEVEEMTMDHIARDLVAEANEDFYANTELGKTINEHSAMKYDSDLAKGIQKGTTIAVEVAGATAATVVTGGAAAPALFAVGAAMGAGESAEEKFQDTENRDFWKDSGAIVMNAGIEGMSMVGYGQMGSKALKGVEEISKVGIKKVAKDGLNKVGKDVLKGEIKYGVKTMAKNAAIETIKDPGMYVDAGCVLSDDIKNGLETGEWDIANMVFETGNVIVTNYASNISGDYLNEVFEEGIKGGKAADKWASNSTITDELCFTAEKNRQKYREDFTSAKEYYDDLDHVERNNQMAEWIEVPQGSGKWQKTKEHIRIDENDPGITKCVTDKRKQNWNLEVNQYTNNEGMTTVHVGNTSTVNFEKHVLGERKGYGTLGIVDDFEVNGVLKKKADGYQFVSMGDGNSQGLIDSASGKGVVRKFESDLGIITKGKSDRMVMVTYDVDRSSLGMPTGKEVGSNSKRIPGGRTPNGNLEAVHQTIHIDSSSAASIKVDIIGDNGKKPIWSGSLSDLKDLQLNNPKKYKSIMGI